MARSPRPRNWCAATAAITCRNSSAIRPIRMIHYNTTGPELVEQLERIDAFISGVGTGGTISGTGRYLREHLQNKPLIVAVEPKNSPVLSGGEPGFHKIQGIGAGFVPENLDTTRLPGDHRRKRRRSDQYIAASGARRGNVGRHFVGRQLLCRLANRASGSDAARSWWWSFAIPASATSPPTCFRPKESDAVWCCVRLEAIRGLAHGTCNCEDKARAPACDFSPDALRYRRLFGRRRFDLRAQGRP